MNSLIRRTLILAAFAALALLAVPALAADKPDTKSVVAYTDSLSSYFTFHFSVKHAVRGTRAVSSCKGGQAKGCPPALLAHAKTITATKKGTLSLYKAWKGNKLRSGAELTVRWSDPKSLFHDIVIHIDKNRGQFSSQTHCQQQDHSVVSCPLGV
jgi:hypothetical protein